MSRFLVLKIIAVLVVAIFGLALVGFWNADLLTTTGGRGAVHAVTYVQNPNNAPVAASVQVKSVSTSTTKVSVSSTSSTSVQNRSVQIASVSTSSSNNNTPVNESAANTVCRSNPLDHVYTPSRLQVIETCKTVTGTIESIHPELDGDFHIGLRPDPQFANVVNDCNRNCLFGLEKGRLVVEVVCVFHPIFPKAAWETCEGYRNPVQFPLAYVHASVTGTYVKDIDHGWLEIHPAWEVKQIP